MIWDYSDQTRDALLHVMPSPTCVYCGGELDRFDPIVDRRPWGDSDEWRVRTCAICGWWKITELNHLEEGILYRAFRGAAAGSLKQLDLPDISIPLAKVRSFLAAKHESQHTIGAILLEETVTSVFKELGYHVLVAKACGDDRIDVLLHASDSVVIGVQVKYSNHSIEVSQIRELIGTRVVNGLTKGMFITTLAFQSGAQRTATTTGLNDYNIDLVDGLSFYESLRIAQRSPFTASDCRPLIAKARFTQISDTGTRYIGLYDFLKQDVIQNLPGPGGPQDEWL